MGHIGVAPSNNLEAIIGNSQDIFLLIQLVEQSPIEFSLSEPEEAGQGYAEDFEGTSGLCEADPVGAQGHSSRPHMLEASFGSEGPAERTHDDCAQARAPA